MRAKGFSRASGRGAAHAGGIRKAVLAASSAVLIGGGCAGGRSDVKPGLSAEEQKTLILEALKAPPASRPGDAERATSSTAREDEAPDHAAGGEEDAGGEAGRSSKEGVVRGPVEPVSGIFPGLAMGDVVARVAAQVGWEVMIEPGVPAGEAVKVEFDDVPAYEAIERLARPLDVAVRYETSRKIVRLSRTTTRTIPVSVLWALRPLDVPLKPRAGDIALRYAQDPSSWLEQGVRGLLSGEGKVFVDPIGGTVLVEDRPSVVDKAARYLADVDARLTPVTLEIAIIRTKRSGAGIDWSKVSGEGGSDAAALGDHIASLGDDVVGTVMTMLQPYEPELLSRPTIAALNGWGVVLSVTLPESGKGWQVSVVPHIRGGEVLLEASGGFIDGAAQAFSTVSRVRLGSPVLISPGAATVSEKRTFAADVVTSQEVVFVIRARS